MLDSRTPSVISTESDCDNRLSRLGEDALDSSFSLPLEQFLDSWPAFRAAAFCINTAPFETVRLGGGRSSGDSKVLALKVARAKTLRRERTVPLELLTDSGMLVTVLLRVRLCLPVLLGVTVKDRGRSSFDDDGVAGNFTQLFGEQPSP
jgi:hypothetical protein